VENRVASIDKGGKAVSKETVPTQSPFETMEAAVSVVGLGKAVCSFMPLA